ncbi:hypothetical protein ACFOSV_08580 [Algoriphagus namhaensis]|uniref:6-bladed beta-propeller protein n=1 Tax=Algoriphagus namhaensis TaxID=915353 RepID=A0ABV8ATZ8_9BACT
MNKQNLLIGAFTLLLLSCGKTTEENAKTLSINDWDLVILDSVQVDILGDISTGDFQNGVGLLFDYTSNTLYKIDETGHVLASQSYSADGVNPMQFITTVKIDPTGTPHIMNYRGQFYNLNPDLSIKEKIEPPFPSLSYDGRMDSRDLEFWKDDILMIYAGRDEVSPYTQFYFRDNPLVEKLNPRTGESMAMIRTPASSKFASDLLYERPTPSFSLSGDSLYLYFDNEPMVHIYELNQGGEFIKSLEIPSSDFLQTPELKDETEWYDFSTMISGRIMGVFADKGHLVVHYSNGVNEEVFTSYEFDNPENFPKIIKLDDHYFQIYDSESGWSNPILIPKKVDKVFALPSIDQPFFALRNDEYLEEEQDYLTLYKLQLIQK